MGAEVDLEVTSLGACRDVKGYQWPESAGDIPINRRVVRDNKKIKSKCMYTPSCSEVKVQYVMITSFKSV